MDASVSDIGNDNLRGVEGRRESEVKVHGSSIFSYSAVIFNTVEYRFFEPPRET